MNETTSYEMPEASPEPFTGDRGWKNLDRSPGEGAMFAIVVALLAVAVLAGLVAGIAGVGLVFVLLAFVSMALLVVISLGG